MDIQECPAADIAIVNLVVETIKAFVSGKFLDVESQMKWKTETLAQLLERTTDNGQQVVIDNHEYLSVFGMQEKSATVGELWQHILERIVRSGNGPMDKWRREIDVILKEGTLAQRILKALGPDQSRENIISVYKKLSGCLAQNKMFFS
jgi:carboxylate-amine ligase